MFIKYFIFLSFVYIYTYTVNFYILIWIKKFQTIKRYKLIVVLLYFNLLETFVYFNIFVIIFVIWKKYMNNSDILFNLCLQCNSVLQ